MRFVARRLRLSLDTVQRWCKRAGRKRLDRVDFADRPSGNPLIASRFSDDVDDLILLLRRSLREDSSLGEFGAAAIHRALRFLRLAVCPSIRTINRILERNGALDHARRIRRAPPPKGWYLPDLAAARSELDSFDVLEDLPIQNGPILDILNVISLHGSISGSWPSTLVSTDFTLECMLQHWRRWGLPTYAQFDNDTRFQGPHQHPESIGRVIRLCLALDIVPVFAPPREPGFQNQIENFNRRWRQAIWERFHFDSPAQLCAKSTAFLDTLLDLHAKRRDAAPFRRPFPTRFHFDPKSVHPGRIIYLRRTCARGTVCLLGRTFKVSLNWPYRLVRAEFHMDTRSLNFFALRRRAPSEQPLLRSVPFSPRFLPQFD